MAERRVLPPRSNRGKRPPPSEEEKRKEEELYSQLFEQAQNDSQTINSGSEVKVQRCNLAQIEAERTRFFEMNRSKFQFSRGYHYFFDLSTFPRVANSPSYAVDDKNAFNSTYSQ